VHLLQPQLLLQPQPPRRSTPRSGRSARRRRARFSKALSPEAEALVGRRILFHWPVVGWHVGELQERITDARIKRNGNQCNFKIFYEVDDEEVPTSLRLDEYGAEDEFGWVLLEAAAGSA
jgi:hypothetical protein